MARKSKQNRHPMIDIIDTDTPKDAAAALSAVLTSGDLVELYEDRDADKFAVGRVDALSGTHVRIWSLDLAGRLEGIQVKRLNAIERIVTGSDYLVRRMARLESHWRNTCLWPEQRLTGSLDDLMLDALALSLEDGTVVSISIGDKEYNGPVVKLSDDAGTIADLNNYGERVKEVSFRTAEIGTLCFGSDDERIPQFLMGNSESGLP